MIKIKGKSVYPEDIENIIFKSRLVKDCAISSFKNKDLEEQLCLFYVLKTNNIKDKRFKNYCINSLPPFHLPRYFFKTNKIPRNNMGKLKRIKLNKLMLEKINE